jgi:hypothetical protein
VSAVLALAALALAAGALQQKAPQGAGTLWLAGAETTPPTSERPALLLVAAAPDSPAPLDARAWGGGADTALLDVQPGNEPDAATLGRVRAARRLLLGPGDPAEWRAALWDAGRPRPLALALREAWSSGAEVAARGAGALLLGGAHLDSDAEARRRNPRQAEAAALRPGLGWLDVQVLDGAARGSDLGHLGRRMLDPGLQRALWIPAGGGVRCEPATGRWTGFGAEPALAFDGRAARRTGARVDGVLVEWLERGRSGGARDPLRAQQLELPVRAPVREVPDVWDFALWARAPESDGERAWAAGAVGVRLQGLPALADAAAAARLTLERAR